jgi:hypothetical protein
MDMYKAVVLCIVLLAGNFVSANDDISFRSTRILLLENATKERSEYAPIITSESLLNVVAPPANDDLCNAHPLTLGAPCVGYSFTTIDATTEPDEYYCSYTAEKSVWFSFVAPESGTVYITTSRELPGSVYLTRMIYEEDGSFDCSDLSTILDIGCNYDDGSIYDDTLAVCGLGSGLTYYIQIFSEDDPYEANFCIEVFEDLPDAGPDQ